jgi:hypothetical protein
MREIVHKVDSRTRQHPLVSRASVSDVGTGVIELLFAAHQLQGNYQRLREETSFLRLFHWPDRSLINSLDWTIHL